MAEEGAFELLDRSRILKQLRPQARQALRGLCVLFETDSTNQRLLERAAAGEDIHAAACLAELQSAGRGRRGRRWEAPLGSGLCLSLGWRLAGPAAAQGLSLAAGVALAGALGRLGARGLGLKWPNDVLWGGGKLAGVLVELGAEGEGPCTAVIGIGLNLSLPASMRGRFDPPCVDLRGALGNEVSRNEAAAAVLEALLAALPAFARSGFAGFAAAWRRLDVLRGREVELRLGEGQVTGRALGVDEDGALRIRLEGGQVRRFASGEVSVRGRGALGARVEGGS